VIALSIILSEVSPRPVLLAHSVFETAPRLYPLSQRLMLSLTHAARQHIADTLSKAAEGEVLRISSSPEGIRIAIDRVRIGDTTFNESGKCILAIDQMVLRSVTGKTLDLETEDGKAALVLLGE